MAKAKQERVTTNRHALLLALVAIVVAVFATVIPASPASAASSSEFASDINGLRASKGLPALTVDSRLNGFAQAWAEKMAAAGSISHNPSLSSMPGNWTKAGENVGVGGSADSIFNALVASPGHYSNMVDSKFTAVGIGVATGADGRIYTTHDFAAYPAAASTSGSSAKTATTAKAAPTTAAPKKTTTTAAAKPQTTAAPVTTAAPAPAAAPVAATPPAPVDAAPPAPALPLPSDQIVQSLNEVSGINTQG